MRLPEEPEIPAQINIVSMIDVIFSILAFFLVSSVYLTRSEGLDVNLPKASTATVQKTEQINVTIQADGAIALNRQPVQLDNLQTSVQQLVKPEVSSMVVLNADEKVNHGRVVAVMDRLRQIEGVQLAIAAQRPQ
jgi:biopolymer transport protein ExbD